MAGILKNLGGKTPNVEPEAHGLSAANFKESVEVEVFEHKDENAEVDGEMFFNPSKSATLDGATTAAPTLKLADDIVFANSIANFGGVTNATYHIRKMEQTRAQGVVRTLSIEAKAYGRFAA
jgi:hypothetical protein